VSRLSWHRAARIPVPSLPGDRMVIPAPPPDNSKSGMASWASLMLPMLSTVSIAGYMLIYRRALLTILAIGILVFSIAVTAVVRSETVSTARRARDRQRVRYFEHLDSVRKSARLVAAAQRAVAAWQWPSPPRLLAVAHARRRVWERRPGDPDFLCLRIGTGRAPLASELQLNARADPAVDYDPEMKGAADKLVAAHRTVGRQPATIDLGRAGVVSVIGAPRPAQSAVRALLGQLAVLHAPDDVQLMVSAGGDDEAWAWAAWLPHTRDPKRHDLASLVASGYDGLADAVDGEVTRVQAELARVQQRFGRRPGDRPARHAVVVIDSFGPTSPWAHSPLGRRLIEAAGPETGLTVIALVREAAQEPSRVGVRVRLDDEGGFSLEAGDPRLLGAVPAGTADQCPVEIAEATARAIAPLLLTEAEPAEVLTRTVSLPELLGAGDLDEFDPTGTWVRPGDENVLRVPVGIAGNGDYLVLDLKEAAQDGMGPHGLIVGATGSGKSELLRTLLTGLTATHPPDLLSMVLVDFKGGATFAGMTGLPHVAGLITNLADDQAMVDRMQAALVGEQQRRQRLLRDAGHLDSVTDYQARQAAGERDLNGRPLEPLPYLLVVVDEFGELLTMRPEFISLFVQIGRVGRSLGMHLLFATQRLEEGRLRGLESHLSYRICLRTFSAAESRAVIGTTDAYHLPQLPGSAYLKVGESVYERFRVAHVSGPHEEPGEVQAQEPPGPALDITVLGLRTAPDPDQPEVVPDRPQARLPRPGGRTQMQAMMERLRRFGHAAHQVWLPPLPACIPLDLLLGPVTVEGERGWQSSLWTAPGSLMFPVGVMDLPANQEQRPVVLDFSQMNPHLLLVGAPQSGKSTFLRTLMLSAMLTHTPREIQFYCLDYGGGTLHSLDEAPHVSGVVARGDTARARRALREVQRLIAEREVIFRERGIRSVAELREVRDRESSGLRAPDVFLVADGWGVVRSELPDVDPIALDIAARGPNVGVHVVITASRWGDIRMNLRDSVSARLELRLNDSGESEVSRAASKRLPAGVPGRGIAAPGLVYHAALPRLDGQGTVTGLGEAQDEVVGKIAADWAGPTARPIRMLPALVRLDEGAGGDGAGRGAGESGVPVAISDRDLEPVFLDLAAADQHCVVVGDSGAGKSAFLRTWLLGMAGRHDAADVRFMVIDYRRALLGTVPDRYIGAYASDDHAAGTYAGQLAETLAGRLPPPEISAADLRRRSWWTGPELYLVIDDYDLLAAPGRMSPVEQLVSYLAHGRDVGFHVVLARRSGGMSRVLASDPVLARIRDMGTAALMLSSDPREGALFGDQRGFELPPGRGVLVRRGREAELVQVLMSDDPEAG
jgi:DNA segregation ATPase FtsK/SpoIIIE, S-DNA-T family